MAEWPSRHTRLMAHQDRMAMPTMIRSTLPLPTPMAGNAQMLDFAGAAGGLNTAHKPMRVFALVLESFENDPYVPSDRRLPLCLVIDITNVR